MAQTNITTAGIDTSKLKLDIAVHGRTERWQVANVLSGWRVLAANLAKVGVTRVGIEATGGYERGVVEHLRAAGFTVLVLQPIQVKAFGRVHLRRAMCGRLRVGKSFFHVLQDWSVQPCVRPLVRFT
jgi:transposase